MHISLFKNGHPKIILALGSSSSLLLPPLTFRLRTSGKSLLLLLHLGLSYETFPNDICFLKSPPQEAGETGEGQVAQSLMSQVFPYQVTSLQLWRYSNKPLGVLTCLPVKHESLSKCRPSEAPGCGPPALLFCSSYSRIKAPTFHWQVAPRNQCTVLIEILVPALSHC